MPLITTPGASDANSYASVLEADAYFSGHVYASGWFSSSTAKKEQSLIQFRRMMDAMPRAWTGEPSTETQALGWPRVGMRNRNGFVIASGVIPNDLKDAQSEGAGQLIVKNLMASNSSVLQGIASASAGPVSVTFEKKAVVSPASDRVALKRRDSLEAMIPDAVILLLVPSWLKDVREEDSFSGLIMETL